jgi:opacity protein-like surface antigen
MDMNVLRQLTKFAAGTAVLAGTTVAGMSIAQADGMPSKGRAVVYEKPYDWGGFYFGLHSGFQWSDFDATFTNGNAFGVSHDSQVVGGQIGIQHQFGNFVLGVEGALTVAFQDDFASTDCPNPAITCAARFDDVLTIGPRLGWAMGKWMPYITGGYANARFTEKGVVKINNADTRTASERHSGWYIGGGVDMALSHGWTIGLDYRHYEFDDATYDPANPAGVVLAGDRNVADASSDVISLRVSWKLGRPDVARPLK